MNLGKVDDALLNIVTPDAEYSIGDICVTPFSIPHDAADPCGYIFTDGITRVGIATDIGHISDSLFSRISGCKSIILESNHDIDMLRYGDYPYPLKQRILSDHGHLSNESAAETALRLVNTGTEHIMLGHLSEHNNLPEIAQMETFNKLTDNGVKVGTDVTLQVAKRYDVTIFDKRGKL
jgi:phosphoribosyl 1,2-cyclic phosphodiesterase